MDSTITTALKEGRASEELDLWEIHRDHINQVWKNGGKSRYKKAPVHPTLLNWAIAFHAKTSVSIYKEVQKIMQLPDISYIYRKTNEMVSTTADRGYSINITTIKTISERAKKDNWSEHARNGVLAQDSCSLNAGIEHDHVSNRLIGGDETHKLGNLTNMFHLMAQQVRDSSTKEIEDEADTNDKVSYLLFRSIMIILFASNSHIFSMQPKNSILDELRLAQEHLVFKWTSLDPKSSVLKLWHLSMLKR